MESLQPIGIISAGTKGSGIARVCAHAGLSVSMPDVDEKPAAHRYAEAAAALVRRPGDTPAIKELPGNARKRLRCPIPDEAVPAYSQGLASVEEVVEAMQSGCNHREAPEGWAPA